MKYRVTETFDNGVTMVYATETDVAGAHAAFAQIMQHIEIERAHPDDRYGLPNLVSVTVEVVNG